MKYKYNGTDERVFPSLGIAVKPGEEFEAPENFSAHDVVAVGAAKPSIKPTATPSAEKQESETK